MDGAIGEETSRTRGGGDRDDLHALRARHRVRGFGGRDGRLGVGGDDQELDGRVAGVDALERGSDDPGERVGRARQEIEDALAAGRVAALGLFHSVFAR